MVAKSAFSPRLVIIEGKDKGKVISLQNGTAVIGRSKGDVLIQDPRVSRSHIALHFDERTGQLTFTDLKSLNGSLVNGDRVDTGELHDGDKLQLGNTVFDCQISADDGDTGKFIFRSPFKRKESEALDENDLVPLGANEQSPEIVEREDLEKTSTSFIPRMRKAYLKMPPKTRVIALSILALLAVIRYLPKGPSAAESAAADLETVRALATQGKIEEAIAKAVALRERDPSSLPLAMTLGQLYESQQKYELAISAYQKVRELNPADVSIQSKIITLYLSAGLVKEAQENYGKLEQLIKDGPRTAVLFKEAARLLLEHKELNPAPEKTYIIAKALQSEYAPEDTLGYKLEAQVLLQQGRPEEAMAALLKSKKMDQNDEWVLENIAFAKLTLKDMAGAVEVLQEWANAKPNSTKPLLVMSYLRYNEKDLPNALLLAQKILQITAKNPRDPHLPEALNLMGQIYLQENQVTEATDSLRRACDLGFKQACDNDVLKRSATAPGAATPSGTGTGSGPASTSTPGQAQAPAPAPAASTTNTK